MKRNYRVISIVVGMAFACVFTISAQQTGTQPDASSTQTQTASNPFSAGLSMNIGAETIDNVNWQMIGLDPTFSIWKFGVGLDLTLHYRFTGTGNNFEIRQEDWVPDSFSDFLSLYLPKIRYISYGQQGDPIYGLLGSVDSATLGNGFIVGGYTNTLLAPDIKQFGLEFGIDGNLFKFPYVGMQTFVANLAQFDVLGADLYVRPLVSTSIPILKDLQISGIVAADRDPYLYYTGASTPPSDASVTIFGTDLLVPILSNPVVSLASMASLAFEPSGSGGMIGVGGKLFSFMTYEAQIQFLGDDFIPDYFGPTYDLYRVDNYEIASGAQSTPGRVGWFALAGFSALSDKIVFNVSVDGPFAAAPTGSTDYADYPHLRGIFEVEPGVIPGFYFTASYDKKLISSFADLINAENAVIGASVNYQSGPAVITLSYALKYDPTATPKPWDVTSSLSTSISLF